MLIVENIKVFNFEGAMRGLRNPKDSWHLSDSNFNQKGCLLPEHMQEGMSCARCQLFGGFGEDCIPYIGPKDMKLAQAMIGAGTDEAKFLRQIFISMDITAPLYWWKEFDTYKVGTVANSCSTMHKLDAYPIERSMFSWDNVGDPGEEFWATVDAICAECERLRLKFKETGDKTYWRALVQLLPNSWMQKRTVTINYQVARAQYFARRHHKLTEWHTLCDVYMELPYGKEFIGYEKQKKPAKIVNFYMTDKDIIIVDENGSEFSLGAACEEFRKQMEI
jgi:hypothetical protein